MKLSEFFQLLKKAIETEIQEGTALTDKLERLESLAKNQASTIAALEKQLVETQAELASAMDTTSEEMLQLIEELKNINPTPVGDALVEEVQSNQDIETPETLEEVVVPSTDVTSSNVVSESLDALEEFVVESSV